MLSGNKLIIILITVIILIFQPVSFSLANVPINSSSTEKSSTDYILTSSEENKLTLHETTYNYFSTFLGETKNDYGCSVASDSEDSVLVAGYTCSNDFPVLNAYDLSYNGGYCDAFVTKFSSSEIVWSTFLGGFYEDSVSSVAVDSEDNVLVTGVTWSNDFPVMNAHDDTSNGEGDAFITKFDNSGSLLWSTFFGGSDDDIGKSIAIDSEDAIIITGYSSSENFPVLNGLYETYSGGYHGDAFVSKFDSSGNLVWSTYLGGNRSDEAYSVDIDSQDSIIITGYTGSSDDFPIMNAYDDSFSGGSSDAFITKLNHSGELLWSTYLGGSEYEEAYSVALDSQDNIIVTGVTYSSEFPVLNGYDETFNIGSDEAFVTRFNSSGNLVWSTFLGGTNWDQGHSVAIDTQDNLLIAGRTESEDFPILNAYNETYSGGDSDAFVLKLGFSGNLIWSTYLGGYSDDWSYSICVDIQGSIIVTGHTYSGNFPVLNAFDETFSGGSDAFLCRLSGTPLLDEDDDGLATYLEYRIGTDPLVEDTDGDDLSDSEEVSLGTNPLIADTDGDGYSDGEEVEAGTDPLDEKDHPKEDDNLPIGTFLVSLSSFAILITIYRRKKRP